MVKASRPVASRILCAARPARAIWMTRPPLASTAAPMAFSTVVLPTPAPPLRTLKRLRHRHLHRGVLFRIEADVIRLLKRKNVVFDERGALAPDVLLRAPGCDEQFWNLEERNFSITAQPKA